MCTFDVITAVLCMQISDICLITFIESTDSIDLFKNYEFNTCHWMKP